MDDKTNAGTVEPTEVSPAKPVVYWFIIILMFKSLSILLATLFLISCLPQKELLPGEEKFNEYIERAEQLMQQGKEKCMEINTQYEQGVASFKMLMPELKGLALQKRDSRLGVIREFIEDHCS